MRIRFLNFVIVVFFCVVSCFGQKQEAAPTALAPAPPENHRIAPKGVFYLMERISIKSDSGIIGFAPGTRVKLVEDRGDEMVVTDGETKFNVPGDKVTNDIDLAALVAKEDARSQEAARDMIRAQLATYRADKEKEKPIFDQQQREAEQRRAAAANTAKGANPLDRGAYHEKESRLYYWHHPFIYRVR